MAFSIATLRIKGSFVTLNINDTELRHLRVIMLGNDECRILLLSVIMLIVIILSVIMLSVVICRLQY